MIAVHVTADPLSTALIADRIGVDLDASAASDLTDAERERVAFLAHYATDGRGYLELQNTRPQSSPTRSPTRPSPSSRGSPRSSRSGRTRSAQGSTATSC